MRRRALRLLASTVGLLTALPTVAAADPVPSLDLRGFRAPIDPGSGVTTQPADAPGTGEWNAGVFFSYAYRPVTLKDASTNVVVSSVIKHQVSSDLVAGVGLWHRLHVGIDLPVVVYQTGDAPSAAARAAVGDYKLPNQAIGDLGLDAKITVVRPTGGELGGFALAVQERLTVPTGDPGSFLGEGSVTNEIRALAEYRLSAWGFHGNLGFKARGHTEDFACGTIGPDCPSRFGHEVPFGLGVSLKPKALGIDAKGRMTWFVEMSGHLPASPLSPFKSTPASSLAADAAVRVALGADVSLLAGVQTALIRGVGDSPVRGVLSVSWAPRDHDRDKDGIPDEIDHCPDLPEDFDGFEDHDGCPELDNDHDGIPDRADKCPNTPEDIDGFQDADGCPDPDNDQDRIPDAEDACPNEPGSPNPDPRKNGCPVRDRDADGIPDERDACPDEPGTANADPRLHGCPPGKDTDGDGIPDVEDACPTVKGVRSPNPKENGCPDPDPDKDTFVGDEDKCPNEPETWNGFQDADGCPDQAPKKTRPSVKMGETPKPPVTVKEGPKGVSLELSRPLGFLATEEVDAPSLLVLRAVASTLLQHPEWKIHVGVRPSPKPGGEAAAEARARAVVAALRRYTRRDHAAEIAAWSKVKDAPRAAELGIGLVVDAPAPPVPAKK